MKTIEGSLFGDGTGQECLPHLEMRLFLYGSSILVTIKWHTLGANDPGYRAQSWRGRVNAPQLNSKERFILFPF
jgi:hypothetical protein